MANRTKLVESVARGLRPDVFYWTKANYDKDLAIQSWNSIDKEQVRLKGIVEEVLLNIEKIGYRIFDPSQYVCDEMVELLGKIPTLFPTLEIHKKFQGKFFKKMVKSRRIR